MQYINICTYQEYNSIREYLGDYVYCTLAHSNINPSGASPCGDAYHIEGITMYLIARSNIFGGKCNAKITSATRNCEYRRYLVHSIGVYRLYIYLLECA